MKRKKNEDNLTKRILKFLFRDTGHFFLFFFLPNEFPFNLSPVMKHWICGPVLQMEQQWHIIYTAVPAVSGRGLASFLLASKLHFWLEEPELFQLYWP